MSRHAATESDAPELRVLAGHPNDAELAAVTAVIATVLRELDAGGPRSESDGQSAWQKSQRPVQVPIVPGTGAWRSYSA